MSERRTNTQTGERERRSFPRPPFWLNLLILLLGIGGVFYQRYHREIVEQEFAHVITEEARTPADVRNLKNELAEMDLSQGQLQQEVEGRAQFLTSLKSEDFYLAVDTKGRKLKFYYGARVLREDDLSVGESRTISAGGKQWTFIPLKGAFPVEAKIVDYAWPVPEWMYAIRGEATPAQPATIPDGLGKYVIFLPNGYVIHTQPSAGSPLQSAKPGSFMVSEDAMRAIWPRIHQGTQVFIF